VTLRFHQSYAQRETTADKKQNDWSVKKLKSKIGATHLPSAKMSHQLDFEISDIERNPNKEKQIAQALSYRINYQLRSNIQILTGIEYLDTDIDRPNSETQTIRLELRSKFFKNFDLRLYCKNQFQARSQKVAATETQNTLRLQLIYEW
jgi:hypothetical protein